MKEIKRVKSRSQVGLSSNENGRYSIRKSFGRLQMKNNPYSPSSMTKKHSRIKKIVCYDEFSTSNLVKTNNEEETNKVERQEDIMISDIKNQTSLTNDSDSDATQVNLLCQQQQHHHHHHLSPMSRCSKGKKNNENIASDISKMDDIKRNRQAKLSSTEVIYKELDKIIPDVTSTIIILCNEHTENNYTNTIYYEDEDVVETEKLLYLNLEKLKTKTVLDNKENTV